MKSATSVEILIGMLSLVIFIYRLIVVMFPMFQDGIKERNYGKMMNSLTLLV